jgi:hypothetical protein
MPCTRCFLFWLITAGLLTMLYLRVQHGHH